MNYDDSGNYQTGNASLQATDLKNIDIEWVSGSVTVKPHDKDTVEIFESYNGDEDGKLCYRYENGTLSVKFRKPKWFFGFGGFGDKNLTVLVPETAAKALESFNLKNVSAEVSLSDLSGEDLRIETVSGNVTVKNTVFNEVRFKGVSAKIDCSSVSADKLEHETVSGEFSFHGSLSEVKTKTVSGRLDITSEPVPASVQANTVSGGISLTIPEDSGFQARYKKVSGDFSSDFTGTAGDKTFEVGDRSGDFRFETVSGDIRILKK